MLLQLGKKILGRVYHKSLQIGFKNRKMSKGTSGNVSSKCASSGQKEIITRIEVLFIIVEDYKLPKHINGGLTQ